VVELALSVAFLQDSRTSIGYAGVMLTDLCVGAIVGGTVLWLWGAVSWMALPWHHATFLAFANEDEVVRLILTACPRSGVYGLPAPRASTDMDKAERETADRAAHARMVAGPIVTAIVQRNGFGSVPMAMLRAYIIYMLASVAITWLLLQSPQLGYWQQVAFVGVVGLSAAFICRLPDWNWHGYSTDYTAVNVADHVVGAVLLGLALAAVV
jgi:hypothetical protein